MYIRESLPKISVTIIFRMNSGKKLAMNQFYNYKISFEYTGDGMKDMIFSMDEIFLAS